MQFTSLVGSPVVVAGATFVLFFFGWMRCPNLSRNGWPPTIHSFCIRLWNPLTVLHTGSSINWTKQVMTGVISIPLVSVKSIGSFLKRDNSLPIILARLKAPNQLILFQSYLITTALPPFTRILKLWVFCYLISLSS